MTEGLSRPSAGAYYFKMSKTGSRAPRKLTSRRSTFGYIVKPEVVAIGGRRCGHHRSTAERDANAVACRMDCAGRLWVAISVARSDVWQAPAGARPSLLIMYTSILGAQAAQVVGPGAWAVGELIGAVCEGHGRELGAKRDENRLNSPMCNVFI